MKGTGEPAGASRAIVTVPNLLSAIRIALIPLFCWLIVDPDTTRWGIIVFVVVVSTDWVDGTLARRTGQVSELGKVLDPIADRLAIASGLIALMVRGAFPVWAGALILVRDLLILGGAVLALTVFHVRLDVRYVGKVATFCLMIAVPAISWGILGYALAAAALAIGWISYAVGIVEYYVSGCVYAFDIRRARSGDVPPGGRSSSDR